jgi:hypothetical protein
MCILAEMTCSLLVFCIPATPKAFGGNTLMMSKLAYSFRSWTRIRRYQSSGSVHSKWDAAAQPPHYRKMEEDHPVPLGNLPVKANRKTTESPSLKDDSNEGNHSTMGVILRTTDLVTKDGATSELPGDQQHLNQHPWMKPSVH